MVFPIIHLRVCLIFVFWIGLAVWNGLDWFLNTPSWRMAPYHSAYSSPILCLIKFLNKENLIWSRRRAWCQGWLSKCCYWFLGIIRSLRNCNLRGPLPDLRRIPHLLYLDLSFNQLNGSIPPNKLSENITTMWESQSFNLSLIDFTFNFLDSSCHSVNIFLVCLLVKLNI